MAFAACVAALGFPESRPLGTVGQRQGGKLPRAVWLAAFGVSCMALVQAMMFACVERSGADRGFGAAAVAGVLIAPGFVNLMPAPLSAFLQRRIKPRTVLVCGPVVQVLPALLMTQSHTFIPYAAGAMFFAAPGHEVSVTPPDALRKMETSPMHACA
jgi:predicted MFS family arabinose efflux permease